MHAHSLTSITRGSACASGMNEALLEFVNLSVVMHYIIYVLYKCIIHLLLVILWQGSDGQFLICCKVGFNIGNGTGFGSS